MNITVQTPEGTYIVPPEKHTAFITWLNQNAIKVAATQPLREIQQINQQTILLNE